MSKSLDDIQFYNQNGISKTLLDFLFPINNSHYIQFNGELEPAEKFGGTWELDNECEGRFLIGAGGKYELGATGGSEDATLIKHGRHLYYIEDWIGTNYMGEGKGNVNRYLGVGTFVEAGSQPRGWYQAYGNEMYPAGQELGEDGTGKNMPPFLAVNIWKRIG